MLALRETFRVFTINALFIFERPFVFAGAGFGWHKCVDGYIYIQRKKVVGWNICWFYTGGLLQGTLSPVIPLQGTPSPVNPLAYGIEGLGIYARYRIVTGFISVARLIVPVCRDGMTSRNSFLSSPNTGLLIFT